LNGEDMRDRRSGAGRQSYDEKGLLKQHFCDRRPYTICRYNKNVRRIGRRENAKKVKAEFLIGEPLDQRVDKRNERDESQPSRKVKMEVGEEGRAAARISEIGHDLGHREQAPLKA
jgi:hypothetical protein